MNAAILLVTSAWITGQTPEIIIPVQHNAPAASTSCGASCCDDGCGVGHRLRGRLSGLFHRSNDCCEQPKCEQPKNDCCESRGHRFSFNFHRRDSCDTCSNPCDSCGGPSLFDRVRGMFHRDRGCCADTCCGSGAVGGAVVPSSEPLKEQPKKMPSKEGAKEVRIIAPTAPAAAPIAPGIQNAPALNNATPAVAPRIIESEVRNPF